MPILTSVADRLKSARFELRSVLSCGTRRNAPVRAINRWRDPEGQVYVDDDTELLIDGYQGSANTFAVRCFKSAQARPRALAHKAHAPEQVGEAVRRGVPVMLTLREPFGAVRSTIRRWPGVQPRAALRGYVRYYEAVERYRGDVFVAEFDAVTTDFGAVMVEFNRRYGTDFDVFVHDEETAKVGYSPRPDRIATIADGRRAAAERIEAADADSLLDRATRVYERLRVPPSS